MARNFSAPTDSRLAPSTRESYMLAFLSLQPLALSTPLSSSRRAVLSSASSLALALGSGGLPASAADALPMTGGSPVFGSESIMAQKSHGTSDAPVQKNLKWAVDQVRSKRMP